MKHIHLFASVLAGTAFAFNSSAQEDATQASNAFSNSLRSFNPAVSVMIDTFLYGDDSEEGISHIKEDMSGFGHSHGDDQDHDHGAVENGFNLRHLELAFSAEIDNYFKALAIAAISEDSAEIEVAEIQTTGLPWGFQAKAGKFYSDFGYINAQHSHQWSFTDQPLIYELTLGEHGLNEKGAQLSWLAPLPVYFLLGAEVFQGENEKMFTQQDADELSGNDGPSLGVGWMKLAPLQLEKHELQLGIFGASGDHQEIHEEETAPDVFDDFFLDGDSWFAGADVVYKFDSGKPYGQGDATLQAEYLFRQKDLKLVNSTEAGAPIGESATSEQDGYYLQGTYGFLPRWRSGLRWDQVGLTNKGNEAGEATEQAGDSWRAAAMIDFHPSEFSMIRFQVNNGSYETANGTEDVWEGFLQLTVSLGAHGAHDF